MNSHINKQRALEILGIEENDIDVVKKAYRSLALLYHPDKNSSSDAKERFQEIHEAYVYLNGRDEIEEKTDYNTLLRSFLNNWKDQTVLYELLKRILLICEEKSFQLMNHIDKHMLKTIYELVCVNKKQLHISNEFMNRMEEIVRTKFEKDERIILHPFLDDLDNMYKLIIDDEVYLVPLWHHHLIYDANNGREIYVDCYPLLPENVWIDEYNHIHIEIEKCLKELWENENIDVELGSRIISFHRENLYLKNKQIFIFKHKGINMIQYMNNYDAIEKSDVYIHITIQ